MAHPDNYVLPWMPGGSKFMRNPPPPPDVVYAFEKEPADARTGTNTPRWPDSVPITFRPVEEDTTYLVNFDRKEMK